MAINIKKFFLRLLIAAIAALIKKRETFETTICLESGCLAGENCTKTEKRRYYKKPKNGEPVAPTEVCQIHDVTPPEPEYVTINVCMDSRKINSVKCPRVKTETFIRGSEPTEICNLPHELPPIPWPERTKVRFYGFVPEFLTVQGDRRAFLKKCREHGMHGVRAFSFNTWDRMHFYPWLQMRVNSVGVIQDCPKEHWQAIVTDMEYMNPAWLAEMHKFLSELEEFDLSLILSLTDNCGMRVSDASDRGEKNEDPFMGSRQCMSPVEQWPLLVPKEAAKLCEYSPGGYHSTYRYKYHEQWIKIVLGILNQHPKVPYLIEVQNEFSMFTWKPDAPQPRNWYAFVVKTLMDCGIPRDRIVHSGIKGTFEIIKPHLGIYSSHGHVLPGILIKDVPKEMYPLTMISTDGGGNGHSTTDIDCMNRHGISLPDAKTMGKEIKDKGFWAFEYMPRRPYLYNDDRGNVDLALWDVVEVFVEEFNK